MERVIFVATPHRGSYLAGRRVRSEHSVQGNPVALEEIRRILLERAGIR